VFSGFGISTRHPLAELGLETRELELQQARQSVMLQVGQRCFDLLMADRASRWPRAAMPRWLSMKPTCANSIKTGWFH